MREHKRKDHGAQSGSGAQKVDITQLMGGVDNNSPKEELETCKHILVGKEMENGRHRFCNFAIETLDPNYLLDKLGVVFDSLKCVANLNVGFGFRLENVEEGNRIFFLFTLKYNTVRDI